MKKMKVFLLTVLLLGANLALGQRSPVDAEVAAGYLTDRMEEELELSQDQRSRVDEINLQTFTQLADLRSEVERSEFREAAKDILDHRDAQFLEVLNHDQWRDFLVLRDQLRKEHRRGRQRGP